MQRYHISLGAKSPVPIRVDHRLHLQAAIMDLIAASSADYARWIHDVGYTIPIFASNSATSSYKLFTFSALSSNKATRNADGVMCLEGNITWQVTSGKSEFCEHLCSGMLRQGYMRVGESVLQIDAFEPADTPQFESRYRTTAISPIIMHGKTRPEGKKFCLLPQHGELYQNALITNLKRKYQAVYGEPLEDPKFVLRGPLHRPLQMATVNYKSAKIRGIEGPIEISGSPELLKVAYYCGIGENNASGLGMLA